MSDPVPPEPTPGRPTFGGPLALAAVTLGMIVWPIAFNIGAYGEIFYENVFKLVVAASILLVIIVVNDVYRAPWNWIVRAALASPLLWLLVAAYVVGSTSEAQDRPVFMVWLVTILVVSVPLTLQLLVDMSMPELSRAGSRRITASIVAVVAMVGAVGFVVGRDHPRFMTCADFAIAGSTEPDDCAR